MTLLDQCETVAGGTTDFQQPAELCSIFSWSLNIFLMSVQVEWCMRGIRGSHEAEFASKWSVHNSNDLGHFLRFLSQGWPRTSPYFKSREEALLKTDDLCCYPGEELIRPCLRVQFLGCTEKKNPNGCHPQRISFISLSCYHTGKILGFVPMTDKETLASPLVLVWFNLVSFTITEPLRKRPLRSSLQNNFQGDLEEAQHNYWAD